MILPIDQSGPGSWSLVSFHFLVTLNNTSAHKRNTGFSKTSSKKLVLIESPTMICMILESGCIEFSLPTTSLIGISQKYQSPTTFKCTLYSKISFGHRKNDTCRFCNIILHWNNLEGRWWALGVVFAPWSEEMNHQNLQSKVGARAFESFLRQRRHSCRHLKYDVISFILKPQLPKVRSLHAQRRCRNDFRSSAPTSTSYIGWSLTGLICILRHYRGVTQLSCQGRCPEQSLLSHFRHLEPRRTRCFQSLYSFGQKSLPSQSQR